jgi:ATP-dependent 26S proteasome regulatory subunit
VRDSERRARYHADDMEDREIVQERTQNLWSSFARKFEPVLQSTELDPAPAVDVCRIGGLAAAKEEILTYACAATSPEVYARWGTYPPSGLLFIGQHGVGKRLLARALATQTHTSFLTVNIPRLVLEVIHRGGNVGELVKGWSQALGEIPPLTVFFNELEFSQAQEIGSRRPDLPVGPVMDFLLDVVDRTIAAENHLVVGSTNHPGTLRQAFAQPGRFERVVEVNPIYPDDIVAALRIHAEDSEKRAGHPLFDSVDWEAVVRKHRAPSTGDWIRLMHAVLRRKARCEAAGETVSLVTTADLQEEVDRFHQASVRLAVTEGGNYV